MKKKIILICGASGQLGSALMNIFSKNVLYDAYGLSRNADGKRHIRGDITDLAKLKRIFEKLKPNVVINSAACVNADLCEKDREMAYRMNYSGNKNLLELSKEHNSYFIFISSYYVFDGTKKYYSEEMVPTPINYYGITKTISETATSVYDKSLIIRASKIFSIGYDDRNFIARTYLSLIKNKKVMAVDDQLNNPIHADALAKTIMELINLKRNGVYNIGGEDYVSNYELARLFAKFFGMSQSLVKPTKTSETSQMAQRPRQAFLKIDKLKAEGIETYSLKKMFRLLKVS